MRVHGNTATSPYHQGERFVQEQTGQSATAKKNGAVISDTIVRGALRFIAQQPFIVAGSTDDAGHVWASVIYGKPAFMSAFERAIEIDMTQTLPNPTDVLWQNIQRSPKVGTLLIELPRRRRLRANGRLSRLQGERLRLDVEEAYPNCPKYIHRRAVSVNENPGLPDANPTKRSSSSLTPDQSDWIKGADTFFVASAHPERGVDASHRGGKPGFVRVIDDRALRIPDYAGNSMFNSLGNFVSNRQAGLLFIDFEGSRTIRWDIDEPDHETGGTRRYWDFQIEQAVETDTGLAPVWEYSDPSPFNP